MSNAAWDEQVVLAIISESVTPLTAWEVARRTGPYMGRTYEGRPKEPMGERRVARALGRLRKTGQVTSRRSWDTPNRWMQQAIIDSQPPDS